jgi:hypothetical protein
MSSTAAEIRRFFSPEAKKGVFVPAAMQKETVDFADDGFSRAGSWTGKTAAARLSGTAPCTHCRRIARFFLDFFEARP